jgi:hypothetical protein
MNKLKSATTAVLLCFLLALALSACGTSSSSSAGSTPSTVTNLAVAAASQQVTISWETPATNVPTYNIYWSNSSSTANKKSGNKIANVTSPYVHTGLDNTKTYYYVVTQVVGGVESSESLMISASPQQATPAAPNGLSISATDSQITLAFDTTTASQPKNAGQTCTYNIYYSTSSPVTKTSYTNKIANATFDPVTNTSITIPVLSDGTPYYFVVTVVDNGVESNESDVLTATPMAVTAAKVANGTTLGSFSSPDNLLVEPGNQQAKITWSAVQGSGGIAGSNTVYSTNPVYTIYATSGTNTIKVQNVTSPYTLTGLTNGTQYTFKVTSGVQPSATATPASIINEVPSTVISATPDTKKPNVPSGISASQYSSQAVALSWSADTSGIQSSVAPSVSYNIYFSTTAPASAAALVSGGTAIKNISTNSYVHSGLTQNTTYYYVITAVGEGESAPSSIVSVSL